MTRFALSAPLEIETRLADDVVRHGHEIAARCATAHELARRAPESRVDVALVAATAQHLDAELLGVCDRLGIRVIAIVSGDLERRTAAQFGVDCVAADAAFTEVEAAIEVPLDPAPARSQGSVVAVWGPAGSPGRTSLAIALAAELSARAPSVALADVDVHAASVAPALGLLDESPGFAAACRLVRTGGLDATELDRLAQSVTTSLGSFRVLTGLARTGRWPELAPDRVAATLAECRAWASWTIVDVAASLESDEEVSSDLFAPRRNGATLAVLRDADEVIAVTGSDPVSIARFVRGYGDLVEVIGHRRIRVVANKVRTEAAGIAPEGSVAQTLRRFAGIDALTHVPWDPKSFDAALLAGRPLCEVAGRSKARRAITALATDLVPPARPSTRREARDANPAKVRFSLRTRALH